MAKKSTENKNKKTAKKSDQAEPRENTVQESPGILHFLQDNLWARFLAYLLLALALFFLNLLLSNDDLSKFTLISGIEILLALLIAWSIFIVKRRRDREDNNNGS